MREIFHDTDGIPGLLLSCIKIKYKYFKENQITHEKSKIPLRLMSYSL